LPQQHSTNSLPTTGWRDEQREHVRVALGQLDFVEDKIWMLVVRRAPKVSEGLTVDPACELRSTPTLNVIRKDR
jgi:hypothetical protein